MWLFFSVSPDFVESNFTLEIEVYCSVPVEDLSSKPSTPIKMLKRLKHKVLISSLCSSAVLPVWTIIMVVKFFILPPGTSRGVWYDQTLPSFPLHSWCPECDTLPSLCSGWPCSAHHKRHCWFLQVHSKLSIEPYYMCVYYHLPRLLYIYLCRPLVEALSYIYIRSYAVHKLSFLTKGKTMSTLL